MITQQLNQGGIVFSKPWHNQKIQPDAVSEGLMDTAINVALAEDVGSGDCTSQALVPADLFVVAKVVYKQASVIAGLNVLALVFQKVHPRVQVSPFKKEGELSGAEHEVVAIVRGPAAAILTGERTALNFLQRISGIATNTSQYVTLAKPHGIAILDTRKTTPGLRAFEKYAVRVGGGFNHRFGLYDQILIKDNHIRLAGSVSEAIRLARLAGGNGKIEVETSTIEEVLEAVEARADHIMLDNMSPEMISHAVGIISGRAIVEVSGGVSLSNIEQYFIPGVDAISVGALTHSAPNIDISLEVGI
jgi:nicotinate-nucleotide pyrophosphorylase (carboxylating)